MTNTLFLAWQDPEARRWYPIARLLSDEMGFLFVYTGGALEARSTGRFTPLAGFPDLHGAYRSGKLFPLFTNRLLRASRPDYPRFLEWLDVPAASASPMVILGRSGGQRVTDALEVFPYPEQLPDGTLETRFLVHGLSHMPKESVERAEKLISDERLFVMWDFQNPHDPQALALRTSETYPGDMHLIGYCPRFLRGEILKLMTSGDNPPEVTVERVNPPPAPAQFRILCRLRMKWPPGFQPFRGGEYEPLVNMEEAALQVV